MPDIVFRVVVRDDGSAVIERFTDNVAKGAKRAQRSAGRISKAFTTLGRSINRLPSAVLNLRTAFAGIVVGAGLRKVISTFGEFEKRMNRVAALTGATGREFQSLENLARMLGETTVFSAREAAGGMEFLAKAGFETNQIIKALPATLQLAASASIDLATSADIVTNILTGLRIPIEDLEKSNDILVKAFTSTNVNLTQLGESFKFVGPLAQSAGIDFAELTATIGLLGNAGIQGSLAGTSLRRAIASLLSPTRTASAVLKDLGVQTLDAQGRLRSLTDIIRQLQDSGADTSQILKIFGLRAGPAMAVLVSQGADALADLTQKLRDSGGIAKRVSEVQLRGLTGALVRMRSAVEGAVISIGDELAPTITRIASGIRRFARSFTDALKAFKAARISIDGIQATGFDEFLRNMVPSAQEIAKAFLSVGKVIIALQRAFLIAKVIIIGLAIVGVAAAKTLTNAFFEFEKIIPKIFVSVGNAVKDILADALSLVSVTLTKISSALGDIESDTVRELASSITNAATATRKAAEDFDDFTVSSSNLNRLNKLQAVTNVRLGETLGGLVVSAREARAESDRLTTSFGNLINLETAVIEILNKEDGLNAAFKSLTMFVDRLGKGIVALKAPLLDIAQNAFPLVTAAAQQATGFVSNFIATLQAGTAPEAMPAGTLADVLFPPDAVATAEENINRVRSLVNTLPGFFQEIAREEASALIAGDTEALKEFEDTQKERIAGVTAVADISNSLFGPGGLVSALAAEGSEEAFAINKAFQIGQALMGGAQAVISALGAPFPLNLILPGIIAAITAVQIARIASAKPGGGGGGGGGGGRVSIPSGAAAAPATQRRIAEPGRPLGEAAPEARPEIQVVINVPSGFVGNEAEFSSRVAESIREAVGDGVQFGFETTTP